MSYLLDSDILIYFLKGHSNVVDKISKMLPEELFISRINYTELLYGAYNSSRVEKNLKTVRAFLDTFEVLEFDQTSAEIFAKEKARLKKCGTLIADMDLMIASIAIANEAILMTNNLRHFQRVKGLKILSL
jgi:predicted nucleic acid-binding protein